MKEPDELECQILQCRLMIQALEKIKRVGSCWEWTGTLTEKGYGVIDHRLVPGRRTSAHRFFYELWRGKIENGLDLDHLCRNPACINPDHLEPVTRKENLRRGMGDYSPSRLPQQYCNRGHLLSEDNRDKFGSCKECRLARDRERRALAKIEVTERRFGCRE